VGFDVKVFWWAKLALVTPALALLPAGGWGFFDGGAGRVTAIAKPIEDLELSIDLGGETSTAMPEDQAAGQPGPSNHPRLPIPGPLIRSPAFWESGGHLASPPQGRWFRPWQEKQIRVARLMNCRSFRRFPMVLRIDKSEQDCKPRRTPLKSCRGHRFAPEVARLG